MKIRNHFLAGILMFAAVAGTGNSFADSKEAKEPTPYGLRGRFPELMAKSKSEMAAISTGIDALSMMVKEASASNDKAKMKTALDASLKHLAGMKTHADNCKMHMDSMDSDMSKEGHMGKAMTEKSE
ncbi:MAG: hypothetical protein ABI036_12225 [Fibrobacteria bacterium]